MHQLFGLRGSRMLSVFLLIFYPPFLAGCETAIIKSAPLSKAEPSGVDGTFPGLVYSLPLGQVRLIAERKEVPDKDLVKLTEKLAKAEVALAKQMSDVDDLAAEAEKTKNIYANLPKDASETIKGKVGDELSRSKAVHEGRKAQISAAKDSVESARRELTNHIKESCSLNSLTKSSASEFVKARLEPHLAVLREMAKDGKDDEFASAIKGLKTALDCGSAKYEETVKLELLPISADPNEVYLTRLEHSAFRDDEVKFVVENGLLSSGTFTSTDQTPSIVLKLAQTFAALSGGASPGFSAFLQGASSESGRSCPEYKLDLSFDPSNGDEVSYAKGLLDEKLASYDLDVCSIGSWFADTPKIYPDAVGEIARCLPVDKLQHSNLLNERAKKVDSAVGRQDVIISNYGKSRTGPYRSASIERTLADGFVYRMQRPFRIDMKVKEAACAAEAKAQSATVSVPDSSLKFVLPMTAGGFTQNVVTANFKNGMPVDYSINRPSEINAAAGLPLEILKALISVPTEMLQLKVDYSSKDTALTQAQKNALDAEIALIEARKKYDDAVAAAKEDEGD